MKKELIYSLFFIMLGVYACSDGIEGRIEGQWQLKTVEENGTVAQVDTVFYSFMKGRVFSFILLTSPDESSICYGYIDGLSDRQIQINIDSNDTTQIKDISGDWNRPNRTFDIRHVSDRYLTLFSDYKTYSFKKH
jgi:hypothetical protein